MPLTALEERIEQELERNPVLEVHEELANRDELPDVNERHPRGEQRPGPRQRFSEATADDFARLDRISDYLENEEYSAPATTGPAGAICTGPVERQLRRRARRQARRDEQHGRPRGEPRRAPARAQWTLTDYCSRGHARRRQGRSAPPARSSSATSTSAATCPSRSRRCGGTRWTVAAATSVPDRSRRSRQALKLIRRHLEPAGVGRARPRRLPAAPARGPGARRRAGRGARLRARAPAWSPSTSRTWSRTATPQISKKTGRGIDELKRAVGRLGRLHPHPGKLVAPDEAPPITPDATIRYNDDTGQYDVSMARDPAPDLQIRALYRKLLRQTRAANGNRTTATHDLNGNANGHDRFNGFDDDSLDLGDGSYDPAPDGQGAANSDRRHQRLGRPLPLQGRAQGDPRVPRQQRPQRPLAHRIHRTTPRHDRAGHPQGRRAPTRLLRQGPRGPQAPADDRRGRGAWHPRCHRQPGRQREVDRHAARPLPAPPLLQQAARRPRTART